MKECGARLSGLFAAIMLFVSIAGNCLGGAGVTVNGVDVSAGGGAGWEYNSPIVSLTNAGPFVISGSNGGSVSILAQADCEVIASNLVLNVSGTGDWNNWGVPALDCGTNAVTLALWSDGGQVNVFNGGWERAGIRVMGGSLTVTNLNEGAALSAVGGRSGAGIGGDRYGGSGTVVIRGGGVVATGGMNGAGIGGGGIGGAGGQVTISGGWVTAIGAEGGAGIGGGVDGAGGAVAISGGTVVAQGSYANDIGCGSWGTGSSVNTFTGGSILLAKGLVSPSPSNGTACVLPVAFTNATSSAMLADITNGIARIAPGYGMRDIQAVDGKVCFWLTNSVSRITIGGKPYVAGLYGMTVNGRDIGYTSGAGWRYDGRVIALTDVGPFVISGDNAGRTVSILAQADCEVIASNLVIDVSQKVDMTAFDCGTNAVLLALVNDAGVTNTFKGGSRCAGISIVSNAAGSASLTVTNLGESAELRVTGGSCGAGIGGGYESAGGTVTITGGNVTANGGQDSAGIGGGYESAGGTVTITGGNVTANGGHDSAGIGGGAGGAGGTVTISGGAVTGTGGEGGAGIGGGLWKAGGTVTITGGNVTANGGQDSAGIGGGEAGAGGTVTITGGTVTVVGGQFSAGIGGGDFGAGGTVTITGGNVTATGGSSGAGIGGGAGKGGGVVTITGGDVTATSGVSGVGIGCGSQCYGDGGTVTITGGNVTAKGNQDGAGIGSGSGCASGCTVIVAITGGNVTATGGDSGAGIGGGDYSDGGTVTITGGNVTAKGGHEGAGIGGGAWGAGGTVAISGGTVSAAGDIANGAEDIGYGRCYRNGPYSSGTNTFTGGSIFLPNGSISNAPVNISTANVYCVTFTNAASAAALADITGGLARLSPSYGVKDVVAISNNVYAWLPDGSYKFAICGGIWRADVDGAGTTAAYVYPAIGVTVDGFDIGIGSGAGWAYAGTDLVLSGAGPYLISGGNGANVVSIRADANCTVIASNLVIDVSGTGDSTHNGVPALDCGTNAVLLALVNDAGVTNTFKGGSFCAGISAVPGAAGFASLTVTNLGESAELRVTGGYYGAGIGGGRYGTGGMVAIAGGNVTVKGGDSGAGIGGGRYGTGGTVAITGGNVTVEGGTNGAGIGGGYGGAGGTVAIAGGTVSAAGDIANGAEDIGYGYYDADQTPFSGENTFTGGSIFLPNGSISNAPVNISTANVYCVTFTNAASAAALADITNALARLSPAYGVQGITAIGGQVYAWLPDGHYVFVIGGETYFADVDGAGTTAAPPTPIGLTVNGADIAYRSGAGWTYDYAGTHTLALTGGVDYVISGASAADVGIVERGTNAVTFAGCRILTTKAAFRLENPGEAPVSVALSNAVFVSTSSNVWFRTGPLALTLADGTTNLIANVASGVKGAVVSGIAGDGDVEIRKGAGILNVFIGDSNERNVAICGCRDVVVRGGDVSVFSAGGGEESVGIRASGDIAFDGGVFHALTGDAVSTVGITCGGMAVNGGRIDSVSGTTTNTEPSVGIVVGGDVEITGGTVRGDIVSSSGDILIGGGSVNGTTVPAASYGGYRLAPVVRYEQARDALVTNFPSYLPAYYGTNDIYAESSGRVCYWIPVVSVTYEAQGGTFGGTPALSNVTTFVSGGYTNAFPARASHTFLGWATNWAAASAAELFQPGAALAVTNDHTVYAVWKADGSFPADGFTYGAVSDNAVLLTGTVSTPSGDVVIPDRQGDSLDGAFIKGIDDYAFYNDYAVTSVVMPLYSVSIGRYAFAYCGALKTVTFPARVLDYRTGAEASLSIGEYAFVKCVNLTTVKFPAKVSIGRRAFRNCGSLVSLVFTGAAADVTIDASAFLGVDTSRITVSCPVGAKAAYRAALGTVLAGADFREAAVSSLRFTGLSFGAGAKAQALRPAAGVPVVLTFEADGAPESVAVQYAAKLGGGFTELPAGAPEALGGGRYSVTVTLPGGAAGGFFRVLVK